MLKPAELFNSPELKKKASLTYTMEQCAASSARKIVSLLNLKLLEVQNRINHHLNLLLEEQRQLIQTERRVLFEDEQTARTL